MLMYDTIKEARALIQKRDRSPSIRVIVRAQFIVPLQIEGVFDPKGWDL